ncbi:hypothetical protein PCE1_001154 [Barthelona sp. PCE]
MPRVRKFEDDLIIRAYPEGQLIFEGKGLILLKSRENKDISLIESAIEGKDFVGYVDGTRKPLQYTDKLKAGESYMIIEQLFDDSSFKLADYFQWKNHLLFSIKETVNNRRMRQCYILNVLTDEYRCLGEYTVESNINSNYILLRKCQDDSIWHYNFSADDMDEVHEPDIEQLDDTYLKFIICYNSDCIFSVLHGHRYGELVIFDSQRNQVNLTERFPQLKGLNISRFSNFALLTLTQDVLSMVFIDLRFVEVIHIENGELKMSKGEMNLSIVRFNDLKHIDLNDNSFHHEDCVFCGVDKITRRYGPIKFRAVDNEVFRLKSLHPKKIFFDGIAEVYDDYNSSIRCYFFFKERKLIVLKTMRINESHTSFKYMVQNQRRMRYKIQTVHPNEGNDFFFFFVMAKARTKYAKIHWNDSESESITTILPHCGSENRGFILGLPLNVDYREDDTCLVYSGSKVILELPPNIYVLSVHGSHFDNSACILCEEAIHFFQLNVNGYDVEVQKHIVFFEPVEDVYFNPRPLAETPDHQLFVVHTRSEEAATQHLHCLDWSTGSFLGPVLLFERDEIWKGDSFQNFVGGSYMYVRDGIIKAYVEDGAIKTRFFTNYNLPCFPYVDINHDHNLPNNTVQDMSYEEETKIMVLKTYNVEEDPESMKYTVETFHLPSFLAEASIVEYHMPNYHEHYHNE